jgi:cytochrome P450
MQVFFDSEKSPDLATFNDTIVHVGQAALSPVRHFLITHGLAPSSVRYRRNWTKLRRAWQAMLQEAYERPMSEECTAFWACLRRAFPEAMSDKHQYERAISNLATMYGAGSETTVNAIMMTLGALALDASSLRRLEQVRFFTVLMHSCTAIIMCVYATAGGTAAMAGAAVPTAEAEV